MLLERTRFQIAGLKNSDHSWDIIVDVNKIEQSCRFLIKGDKNDRLWIREARCESGLDRSLYAASQLHRKILIEYLLFRPRRQAKLRVTFVHLEHEHSVRDA